MEYWESKFKEEGAMWDFFPSDSAIQAVNIFKEHDLKRILIPGAGYGRNARLFIENGFRVTAIEISGSAIALARSHEISCRIHHGSVTEMPFDDTIFDGIYCYALIHLLNQRERKQFLNSCFDQLIKNGLMIFVVASVQNSMNGTGRYLSKDRFMISKGLKVFFYDNESVEKEFRPYGLMSYVDIDEPVKFIARQEPIKMISITCKK